MSIRDAGSRASAEATASVGGDTTNGSATTEPAMESIASATSGPEATSSQGTSEAIVEATWHIELTCHCPACGRYVDLLEAPDFWDGRGLDLCEHGTERTKAIEVICPECEHEFEVKTVY